jgi:hypothetical protein
MGPPFSFQALDEATAVPSRKHPYWGTEGTASARWPRSFPIVDSKAHQLFEFPILWAESSFSVQLP